MLVLKFFRYRSKFQLNKIEIYQDAKFLTDVTLNRPSVQIFSPDVIGIRVVHGYVKTFHSCKRKLRNINLFRQKLKRGVPGRGIKVVRAIPNPPNLLKSKIPMSGRGGGGVGGTNFQLLMLSSNLLNSKIPISGGGGGWGLVEPTFNF